MSKKRKWLIAGLTTVVLILGGLFVSGPYLAINGIHNVVASGQYGELWRFVDFDQLRASIRPQVQERIARGIVQRLGTSESTQRIGDVTNLIASPAIDAMVSPEGVATLLKGSAFANRVKGNVGSDGKAHATDPLKNASTHFESLSLFTATTQNAEGQPVVFEFRRNGLSWKLVGLRLPN